MDATQLHHVSLVARDLDRSVAFYRDVLGLRPIDRPALHVSGAWFAGSGYELHIILSTTGSFRDSPTIDTADTHFALRVADFEAAVKSLIAKGYSENRPDGEPMGLMVNRKSRVGYPQAYLLDPDRNVIEINAAKL